MKMLTWIGWVVLQMILALNYRPSFETNTINLFSISPFSDQNIGGVLKKLARYERSGTLYMNNNVRIHNHCKLFAICS